jgi:hypothetical protein
MRAKFWILILVLTSVFSVFQQTTAQQLPSGFVDPRPVLQAAARAIGTDNLRRVTVSGPGYAGMVGQQRLNDKNVDWPRGEPLANYTRTMNWEAKTMKEEFDRKPGLNPASWKYGLGCNQVQRSKLDVSTIVPIHGKPVPWADFLKVVR